MKPEDEAVGFNIFVFPGSRKKGEKKALERTFLLSSHAVPFFSIFESQSFSIMVLEAPAARTGDLSKQKTNFHFNLAAFKVVYLYRPS